MGVRVEGSEEAGVGWKDASGWHQDGLNIEQTYWIWWPRVISASTTTTGDMKASAVQGGGQSPVQDCMTIAVIALRRSKDPGRAGNLL